MKIFCQNFCELIFCYTFRTVLTLNIKTLWQKNPLRKQPRKQRRLLRRRSNRAALDTLKREEIQDFFPFSFYAFFPNAITLLIFFNTPDPRGVPSKTNTPFLYAQ
jgi:hypothetical protein